MISRRSALGTAAAAFMGCFGPSLRPLAAELTAKQFLEGLYRPYLGSGDGGPGYRVLAKRGDTFDDTLSKLIRDDEKESDGDVGRLGADPFVNAQDFDLSKLTIKVADEKAMRTTATVAFLNHGERMTVTYDLVRTPKGWRIADIRWSGMSESLKTLLMGPL
jgi:hypothetical protein